ncbi:MFS transporter [Fructilactobacillus cliffordii]|uniref:MFS transporter n=1 Tax=Fructilactobacillus cliffordii TaxID=2940299 RepID=A0A9Q8ZUS6_9LACO|nr:MFS transporter [Fructilactobacillus cliffordii]USS88901.1 MFS transporter [Fructilactobacillus cliffordii]
MSATPAEKIPLKTNLAILAAAFLSFSGVLLETSMNVTFPELAKELNVSLDTIQWITTGYLLVVTITMSTTAFLLKRYPVKRIFAISSLLFVIGDLLSVLAPNFPVLLAGRLIQAGSTGLAMPMMYQVIFALIPKRRIGTYVGIASMVVSLAPALGPTYGGALSSLLSWRYIFIVILPFILLTFWLGSKTLDLQPQGVQKHFDFVALGWLAITLFSFVWATNQLGSAHGTILPWLIPLLIGLCSLTLFVWTNNHGNTQVLSLHPLKNSSISLNAIVYMMLMFVNIGISFVIPIYSEVVFHVTPLAAGLILLPGSIIGGAISPVAGFAYDRYGAFKPILSGMILFTIATFCFSISSKWATPMAFMLLFSLLRIGMNMAFANLLSNSQAIAPVRQSADVNSLFNMLQQYAGSLGTSLLASGLAFYQNQAHGANAQMAATIQGGHLDYTLLFVIAVIITILAFTNWRLQRKQGKRG